MTEQSSNWKGVLLLIIAGITWGTTFIFIRITTVELGFEVSLMFRLFFALISSAVAFILLNFTVLKSQLFYFKRKVVYILNFLNIGGYLFQYLGAISTHSSKLALLVNSSIMIVPFLSYFLLKESMNYKKISGLVIGIVGLILVTTGGLFQPLLEGEFMGSIYSLVGGIFWACYIVLSRKVLSKKETPYEPLNLSLVSTILSFISLLPLILIFQSSFFPLPPILW